MVRTVHPGSFRRRTGRMVVGAYLLVAAFGAAGAQAVHAQDAAQPIGSGGPAVTAPSTDASAAAPHDPGIRPQAAKPTGGPAPLSPLAMFLGADPVVQGVMILLGLASVATWTVLLVRAVALTLAKRRLRRAIARIRVAHTLSAAGEAVRDRLAMRLIAAVDEEVVRSSGLPGEGVKDRAQAALARIEAAAAKRAAAGTGLLASIGSTGPFVGLFGTVWGIMHSFIGIAESHTTNLAVVAPGIAEALLATGIGLVAAIPAVVIYNILGRSVAAYRALIDDAATLILCHLSRDLDRRAAAPPRPALPIAAE